MSSIRTAFSKATVSGIAALLLVATLCYLAVTGGVQGETFLAAVVAGPVGYLFGKASAKDA